jgi:hypothetical protein
MKNVYIFFSLSSLHTMTTDITHTLKVALSEHQLSYELHSILYKGLEGVLNKRTHSLTSWRIRLAYGRWVIGQLSEQQSSDTVFRVHDRSSPSWLKLQKELNEEVYLPEATDLYLTDMSTLITHAPQYLDTDLNLCHKDRQVTISIKKGGSWVGSISFGSNVIKDWIIKRIGLEQATLSYMLHSCIPLHAYQWIPNRHVDYLFRHVGITHTAYISPFNLPLEEFPDTRFCSPFDTDVSFGGCNDFFDVDMTNTRVWLILPPRIKSFLSRITTKIISALDIAKASGQDMTIVMIGPCMSDDMFYKTLTTSTYCIKSTTMPEVHGESDITVRGQSFYMILSTGTTVTATQLDDAFIHLQDNVRKK